MYVVLGCLPLQKMKHTAKFNICRKQRFLLGNSDKHHSCEKMWLSNTVTQRSLYVNNSN